MDKLSPARGLVIGIILGIIIYIVIGLLLHISRAHAHDRLHPANNACLMDLESKAGVLCCDGSDAEETTWRAKDGKYQVYVAEADGTGEWIDVPESAMVKDNKCPGPTRVWAYHLNGHPIARCVAIGAGG